MNDAPTTLQQAIQYFGDEQVCIDVVASLRWPDGKPTCPACGHQDHYYLQTQRRWKCKECWKQFSVKVGTVLEDSPISLTKWLPALWQLTNCKNGISSYELSRMLGVSQKSCWFMLHRLRFAMKHGMTAKFGENGGTVETDETFVGGSIHRMHERRRRKIQAVASNTYGVNQHTLNKTIVHGFLDRDTRKVRASIVPNVKRATLQEKILNNVSHGATVITDDAVSYKFALSDQFVHEVINHATEYVRGQVHTNGIENFWSLLKRSLRGTYVAVEPFHLERYVDEQVFRFNNRSVKGKKVTDSERFQIALSQIAGKRLTFADATGKN